MNNETIMYIFSFITILLLMYVLDSYNKTSYFGSGPLIFSQDNGTDQLIDNNRLEPVYQKIKLDSYL